MASPTLQINQHPGTFTPNQPNFNGVSGMSSPIHMGPMLQAGLATPTVPGRMGGNGLNVPQTPVMGMMNFGMGSGFYNMVSSRYRRYVTYRTMS